MQVRLEVLPPRTLAPSTQVAWQRFAAAIDQLYNTGVADWQPVAQQAEQAWQQYQRTCRRTGQQN